MAGPGDDLDAPELNPGESWAVDADEALLESETAADTVTTGTSIAPFRVWFGAA